MLKFIRRIEALKSEAAALKINLPFARTLRTGAWKARLAPKTNQVEAQDETSLHSAN